MTTRNCCNLTIKNQTGSSGAAVLCLLLTFLILATLVVTSCLGMSPAVYEGPVTKHTLGPMKLEKGKQYLIFVEARIGFGMDAGSSRIPADKHPNLPKVVTLQDSSGSAVPLIALDNIYKYYGGGKCGISVAAFEAQESGSHYYEITVDRLALDKFAKEFDWASRTVEAVNKIVIREASGTQSSFWISFIPIIAGIVGFVIYAIYLTRKKPKEALYCWLTFVA